MMAEQAMYHQHVSWISEELWFYFSQGGDYLFSRMCGQVLGPIHGSNLMGIRSSFSDSKASEA